MDERRRCKRWHIEKEVLIKLEGAEKHTRCIINDIHFKGARLTLKLHLSVDNFLKMNIMVSEGFAFDAELWVAWHRRVADHNMYGVVFSKIKDQDKEKLYQYVRTYVPDALRTQCQGGEADTKGGVPMQNGTPEDKRIFARFMVNYPLQFLNLGTNKEGDGETMDVSAKGIGVTTAEALSPQSQVEMWLKIPDKGQPFYTRGEVVWSKMVGPFNYRSGITLEKADLMGMSRILRTI